MTPESFAQALRSAHGTNLESVTLYGSGATGDRSDRWSDFNVLVVLKKSRADGLRHAAGAVRRWQAAGNPPPVTMTAAFLRNSADVFPLEWLDMADARNVLAGRDVLRALRVGKSHLRAELERELKVNLLRFHGAVQSVGWFRRDARYRALLIRTGSAYDILLRGALRLLNVRPLPAKRDAAQALAKRWRFDPAPFAFAARLKAGDREARRQDPWPWVKKLASSVESVIVRVDSHRG